MAQDAPSETTIAAKEADTKTKETSQSAIESGKKDSLDTEQVVVFKLAGEEYAAPILDVQEIITTGDITPFPNVPAYIAGIINVRGTVATIINLANRFNLDRKDQTQVDRYIILTYTGKSLFGIMVDEVTSVMKIAKNDIKPPSGISESKIHAEYVQGIAVVGDRVILILDFHKVLDEEAINIASQAQGGSPDTATTNK